MRILFVSGTAIGGSAHSTRELAERLTAHGHDVAILFRVEGPRVRAFHKRAVNLVTKLGTSSLAPKVDRIAAMIGRTPRRDRKSVIYQVWESVVIENSIRTVIRSFGPDVVVASSLGRVAWKRIRQILESLGIPSVLYIREENALGHLSVSQAPPDLLLTNAHTYADRAAELGSPAVMIPSVVTVDRYLVESTRERVLFVNPVPSYGLETALELAAARPDVLFAFVEWWKLEDEERVALNDRLAAKLPNVLLRPATDDPGAVYADAGVLLAPFLLDGRPRVVLEAQANGIPVLARDLPALRETVGPGGRLVRGDASIGEWAVALGELIDDPDRYREACDAARAHAQREEVDPGVIVARFERALADLVAHFRDPSIGPVDSSGAPATVNPELSVVIPVRDAAATIEDQLDALLGQEWDRPWELVVVDNGSRDSTSAIVEQYAARDARVRLVDASDRPGVGYCRNAGIRAARADAIAMCDADDIVAAGWVRAMGEGLRTHELVTGPLDITTLNPDWVLDTRGRAIASGPGQFFGVFEFAHSCNLGFRRSVVDAAGGFDEDLAAGEDIELSGRLWRAGVKLVYLDDAVIRYRYRTSMRGLWRQARSYGQFRPELFRRLEASGIEAPKTGRLRSWAYLVRNVGLLGSRSGRAKWVWIAGGNVGRVEGDLRVPWAGRVR